MAFFVVARDRGSGYLTLVSTAAFSTMSEAMDAARSGISGLGPGAAEAHDFFLIDLEAASPVLVLAEPSAEGAAETAAAYEAPATEPIEEAFASAFDETPTPEAPAPVGEGGEDVLADAIRRATETMEQEGITPPEAVPEIAVEEQAAGAETPVSSEEPVEAGGETDAEPEPGLETVPEVEGLPEGVMMTEAGVALLDEARSTSEPEFLPGSGEADWPWEPGEETQEGAPAEDAPPEDTAPEGQPAAIDPLEEPAVDASDLLPAGEDFSASPVIMGDYAPEGGDAWQDSVHEPAGVEGLGGSGLAEPEPATDAGTEADTPEAAEEDASAGDADDDSEKAAAGGNGEAREDEDDAKAYEPGELELDSYTCDDCVYVNTCPKHHQDKPSQCGSFQWRAG